jgi:tetratricopeptide (TPR) repeat protein
VVGSLVWQRARGEGSVIRSNLRRGPVAWALFVGVVSFTTWQVAVAELRRGARQAFWTGQIGAALGRYESLQRWDLASLRGLQGERDVYTRVLESPEALGPVLGIDAREAAKRCAERLGRLAGKAPLDPETWGGVADFFGALKPENQRHRTYSLRDISVRPEANLEPEDILQVRALELAQHVDPNAVFFTDSLGNVVWNLGLRSLALSVYGDSVVLLPDIEAHPFLDALNFDPDVRETILNAFVKSVEEPRKAEPERVYRHIGFFLLRLERYAEARAAFQVAERAAGSANNYISLQAGAAVGDGKVQDAIRLYRRSLAQDLLSTEERFRIHLSLGELFESLGRHQEAVQQMHNALTLYPREPRALTMLGRIYESLGWVDEAAEQYEKAVDSSQDRIAPLASLVEFYRRAGLPAQALVPARKLVKLQPGVAIYREQMEQIQNELLTDPEP